MKIHSLNHSTGRAGQNRSAVRRRGVLQAFRVVGKLGASTGCAAGCTSPATGSRMETSRVDQRKATSRRWWSPVTVETFELRDERHIAVIGTSYRLRISYSLPQNLTHTQVGARRRSHASRRPEQVPSSNVPITVTLASETFIQSYCTPYVSCLCPVTLS